MILTLLKSAHNKNKNNSTAARTAPKYKEENTMKDTMNKINDEALKSVNGGTVRTIHNPDASYVNIRSTPGMESRVMCKFNNGDKVDTTGLVVHKDGLDWYEIYLDDNVMGWLCGYFIGY